MVLSNPLARMLRDEIIHHRRAQGRRRRAERAQERQERWPGYRRRNNAQGAQRLLERALSKSRRPFREAFRKVIRKAGMAIPPIVRSDSVAESVLVNRAIWQPHRVQGLSCSTRYSWSGQLQLSLSRQSILPTGRAGHSCAVNVSGPAWSLEVPLAPELAYLGLASVPPMHCDPRAVFVRRMQDGGPNHQP